MKIKILVLALSIIGVLLIYLTYYAVDLGFCSKADFPCRTNFDLIENTSLFFPFILFFSLVTLKLPERVFASWLKFTLWTAPAILVLTFWINLGWHHSTSNVLGTSGMFDLPVIILLYSLYTLGSIVTIILAYRRLRQPKS